MFFDEGNSLYKQLNRCESNVPSIIRLNKVLTQGMKKRILTFATTSSDPQFFYITSFFMHKASYVTFDWFVSWQREFLICSSVPGNILLTNIHLCLKLLLHPC